MRIICCNVRCSTGKDGANIWPNRRQLCIDVMRAQTPDIICCQETLADQFANLTAGLPEFDSFGVCDEPHSLNPVNVIFYRLAAFRRVSAGGHWLSETPHIAGSKSWASDCVRLTTG